MVANTELVNTDAVNEANLIESPPELPMIVSDELAELAARYGAPQLRRFNLAADDYIYSCRWREEVDRRAEVVFAIQECASPKQPARVWVHAKSHYPAHILRLPSGGVHPHELVEEALFREIDEEMGLEVDVIGFLGIIEYHFWHGASMMPFASYVFLLRSMGGCPVCRTPEQISDFRAVMPDEIPGLAWSLRSLMGRRHGWGQWRALAHDLVYESLTN